MPDQKVSERQSASTPLDGTETLPIIQAGADRKTTTQAIADLAGIGADTYNIVAANGNSNATTEILEAGLNYAPPGSVAGGNIACKLPTPSLGMEVVVINNGGSTLKIYTSNLTGTVSWITNVSASFDLPSNYTSVTFRCVDITAGVDTWTAISTYLYLDNDVALTANSNVNGVSQSAVKTFVNNKVPYKLYAATLVQTGTGAPTATVLINQLSGAVVWTRSSAGIFIGTLTGAFVANKTGACYTSTDTVISHKRLYRSTDNQFFIEQRDPAAALLDGFVMYLEIKVYN